MQSSPRELDDYISQTSDRGDVRSGSPLPFGTEERDGGVNFAIFSRNASRVRLDFFLRPEDAAPSRTLDLDSKCNRTGDVWHVWAKGIVSGQLYGYRMDGPYEPGQGHRFNFNRLLLDPRATAVSSPPQWDFASALGYDPSAQGKDLVLSQLDNAGSMPKCVFVNDPFDWQGDKPPRHPWSRTVIYEMHVRGLTIRPQSGVDHPGTYRGLMEKIPYLKTLGVTGTHDNDTTAGWYRKLPEAQRETLREKLRTDDRGVVWAMIREALASPAEITIVPAQDFLELDSGARMNSPGVAKGNWEWRLKDGALSQDLAQRMRSLTMACGRLVHGENCPAPQCQAGDPIPQIAKAGR
jgi:hypothetical protein